MNNNLNLKTRSGIWLFLLSFVALPHIGQCLQLDSQLGPASAAAITNVGGGDSYGMMVTPDGRFVVFASEANNLVSSNGAAIPSYFSRVANVFLRDRQLGTTVLVSVNAAGTQGGNGYSFPDAISTNGQYVLFESDASDLIPGDTNGTTDIFLRNLMTGATTLVSVATNGGVGNGRSQEATLSPDGRYVAFSSMASNLVAGDANGIADIFVRDMQMRTTVLASAGASAIPPSIDAPFTAGSSSEWPILSADGRYVAFYSTATNLVKGGPTMGEVYVRDLASNLTYWASTNAHLSIKSPASPNFAMSTNGQYVAYEASAGSSAGVVFRYNLATGMSDTILTNGAFQGSLDLPMRNIDISADGHAIALVASGSAGGSLVELWNSSGNTLTIVSGTQAGADCEYPRLDQTGRFVLFFDNDSTLTTNSDGSYHGYLRDTLSNTVQMIDVSGNGSPISKLMMPLVLSASGNLAAFSCFDGAGAFGPNKLDVFARDLVSDVTECISTPTPGLPSVTSFGFSGLTSFSASSNGQYLAFYSDAAALSPNATNGYRNIFIHDLSTGSNSLVSVASDSVTPGNGQSVNPAISSDGRYVAFSSMATNLIANDTNGTVDVFLRDTFSNSTQLVSVNAAGTGEGNGNSYLIQLSASGQKVLFSSAAANIVPPTNGGTYWRDMQAGTTYAICTNTFASMTPDGSNVLFAAGANLLLWTASNKTSRTIATVSTAIADFAISADGTQAAFGTTSSIYIVRLSGLVVTRLGNATYTPLGRFAFSGDARFLANAGQDLRGTNQLYLYNILTASNTLISQSYDFDGGASAGCDSPAVSLDGRYVAYRSAATNLVPSAAGGNPNVFLYDSVTGATTLIPVSFYGNFAANSRSLAPLFSGNGSTLFFESWATDLVPGDFNNSLDIFALALSPDGVAGLTNGMAPQITGLSLTPGHGQFATNNSPATLTWTAVEGAGYQVQFTDDLSDPDWQILPGPPTVVGTQGQIIDPNPQVPQRFYRVVSY